MSFEPRPEYLTEDFSGLFQTAKSYTGYNTLTQGTTTSSQMLIYISFTVFPLQSELYYLSYLNYVIKHRVTVNHFDICRRILSSVVFIPNLSVKKCIVKEIPTSKKNVK
jgi:uncharacterized protein YfbU (UPF0304 family)